MGQISQADMQTADVIVSTASGAASAVIRAGSMSRFSHAALYIGGGEVIEAIGEGVVRQSLRDALLDDVLAVVYRRTSLASSQARSIVSFATAQVGKSYDYAGVAGASAFTPGGLVGRIVSLPIGVIQNLGLAANLISPESKFFCSELVLMAYEKAGAPITARSATISSPGNIPGSHLMSYVGHLLGA